VEKKRTGFVENEKNPKQNSRNQMMGADQKRCLEERHVKPRIIHHLNSRDDWYTKAPIKVTKHVLYGPVDGEHACLSMAPTLPSCLPASEPVSPSTMSAGSPTTLTFFTFPRVAGRLAAWLAPPSSDSPPVVQAGYVPFQ